MRKVRGRKGRKGGRQDQAESGLGKHALTPVTTVTCNRLSCASREVILFVGQGRFSDHDWITSLTFQQHNTRTHWTSPRSGVTSQGKLCGTAPLLDRNRRLQSVQIRPLSPTGNLSFGSRMGGFALCYPPSSPPWTIYVPKKSLPGPIPESGGSGGSSLITISMTTVSSTNNERETVLCGQVQNTQNWKDRNISPPPRIISQNYLRASHKGGGGGPSFI